MSNDTALANLVVVLADNKYFLGRRVSEWAIAAPTLEASIACAAITKEELGHTRPLYSLIEQLDVPNPPVSLEREDDRERKYCVTFLRERLPSWPSAMAALFLVDTALNVMLEGLAAGHHEVLRRRAARLIADEPVHRTFVLGRIKELAESPSAELLAEATRSMLPELLCWFGPPGEPGVEELRASGFVTLDNDALRQAFLERVARPLREAGIGIGVEWSEEHDRWEYPDLPWENWNSLERRLVETTSAPA
ncbi:MAG: Phenylacetic acid catabolic protein [Gaiellaceae bacterium]